MAAQAAKPSAAAPATAGDGPCALLTNGEVQRVFAGAKPGQLDRSLEKHGILRCVWNHAAAPVGIVDGTETPDPVDVEARTWALGFLDPLRRDADSHVRYETLAGVGDQAIAVVERTDPKKGFVADSAFLVVRRGNRQVTFMAMDLARRERPAALAVLQDLGKAIAKRLE
jgi:hypothetical protein